MSKVRTKILEPVQGERGLEAPLAELLRVLHDHAGALMAVGGEFTVRADRVKIGELPGSPTPCGKCEATGRFDYTQGAGEEDCRACKGLGRKPGKPEPIGETVGFVVQWRDLPQLREESLTSRLMDEVLGVDEEQPALDAAEGFAAAVAPAPEAGELEDAADLDDDEPEDDE